MGLITGLFDVLFGGGRNVVKDTAEVFRVNAEAEAARGAGLQGAALEQLAAEFTAGRGWFDRVVDGLNRLPRPALALGTLALLLSAMIDPVWFAARMQGLALVPEPLWWLLGAIVSFYFGARHQAKTQDFQRSIARTLADAPRAAANIETLRGLRDTSGAGLVAAAARAPNPALEAWRQGG